MIQASLRLALTGTVLAFPLGAQAPTLAPSPTMSPSGDESLAATPYTGATLATAPLFTPRAGEDHETAEVDPVEFVPGHTLVFDRETGEVVYQDAKPKDPWSGSVNIGASLSSGNTNKRTAHAAADAERRGKDDRITLAASWNYSEEKNSTTKVRTISERNTRGKAQYDHFISEKTYLFVSASGENDKFDDLDLRLILSVGAGHQFVERDDLEFAAEVGLSYYKEDRKVAADEEYVAARVAYDLDWAINEQVKFLQDVEALPSLESSDDIYVRKDTRVQVSLTERMFTQFQWILDYDNTPSPGNDRVDNQFLINVGWQF